MERLRDNLVSIRRSREGLRQLDIALASGLTQRQISEMELAKGNPTLESLDKLGDGLGIDPVELLR